MAGDPANADAWLYNNVLAAMPSGVNITYDLSRCIAVVLSHICIRSVL